MELILLIFAIGIGLAFFIRHPIKSLKGIGLVIAVFILGVVGLVGGIALFWWVLSLIGG